MTENFTKNNPESKSMLSIEELRTLMPDNARYNDDDLQQYAETLKEFSLILYKLWQTEESKSAL